MYAYYDMGLKINAIVKRGMSLFEFQIGLILFLFACIVLGQLFMIYEQSARVAFAGMLEQVRLEGFVRRASLCSHATKKQPLIEVQGDAVYIRSQEGLLLALERVQNIQCYDDLIGSVIRGELCYFTYGRYHNCCLYTACKKEAFECF